MKQDCFFFKKWSLPFDIQKGPQFTMILSRKKNVHNYPIPTKK